MSEGKSDRDRLNDLLHEAAARIGADLGPTPAVQLEPSPLSSAAERVAATVRALEVRAAAKRKAMRNRRR